MTGTIILIIVLIITFLLGKYALSEGRKIERQKKFMKNFSKRKGSDFDADMDAQDPKWRKYKI